MIALDDAASRWADTHTAPTAVPFIKSAGGKRQLLPQMLPLIPPFKGRYFEPFLGGGALFFKLKANHLAGAVTLNDANERLIETFQTIRDRLEPLLIELRFYAKRHSEAFYYETRKRQHAAVESRAAQFIYWNRTCFNGLYRVNRKGEFNVPMGRYTNPTICDEPLLRVCSVALKRAKLMSVDFERSVGDAKAGDFVYFDPPYEPISDSSNFTGYTKGGFTRDDQARLRDVALRLKKKGVKVLLSNSSSPYIRQLYKSHFEIIEVEARRAINSKGSKRGPVTEVLIR